MLSFVSVQNVGMHTAMSKLMCLDVVTYCLTHIKTKKQHSLFCLCSMKFKNIFCKKHSRFCSVSIAIIELLHKTLLFLYSSMRIVECTNILSFRLCFDKHLKNTSNKIITCLYGHHWHADKQIVFPLRLRWKSSKCKETHVVYCQFSITIMSKTTQLKSFLVSVMQTIQTMISICRRDPDQIW